MKLISVENTRRSATADRLSAKKISQRIDAMARCAVWCRRRQRSACHRQELRRLRCKNMLDANKSLRFLKLSGEVGERSSVSLGVHWDASWATRPSSESQEDAISDERLEDGLPTPLVIVDCTSRGMVNSHVDVDIAAACGPSARSLTSERSISWKRTS